MEIKIIGLEDDNTCSICEDKDFGYTPCKKCEEATGSSSLSLLEKIEKTIADIESTSQYWLSDEVKKEGEDLLMQAWGDLDRCVEANGFIDIKRLQKNVIEFMAKVVG